MFFFSCLAFGASYAQTPDLVTSEGITGPLHKANTGRITFMAKPIPLEDYKESDFLKTVTLTTNSDLNIRTFLSNSLTNYLHGLAPELSADELNKNGNYQFTFYVDGTSVYTENLVAGAGSSENKKTKTVFRVPLISSSNEDSWGCFLWNRFLINGGEEALTGGTHVLKIEIRPYVKLNELKTGDIIASGQIEVVLPLKKIDEKQLEIRPIQPGSGWEISTESYDKGKLLELKRKIAEQAFKDITGIVVIRNGKLLIEEYFNGAARNTLHDTRSVGKSFASALAGIAVRDGYLKSEEQTLGSFYDLKTYANYDAEKEHITIKNLLTMSAAFAGSDSNTDSPGNEEKMYPAANWVKFALDLPLDHARISGSSWDYFTAGVVVLGDIIQGSVPEGLEKYADKTLFRPLGIKNYKWQYTPQKVANTAGGIKMSSTDLAKFGQLYKNNGRWNEQQVLPQSWVESSLAKQLAIPGTENEFYGYLFWHKTYLLNGVNYEAAYCSGNGGNKIFIFKDQPLVIVITATAYGMPYAHTQIDRMMQNYLLPAITN